MPASRRRRRNKRLPEELVEVRIESLSAEGRGIAHVDDRTVFIDQALVGERVVFKYTRLKKNIAEGKAVEILEPSPDRVVPKCKAFEMCGGCALQHMSSEAQLEHKQKMFLDHLEHIARAVPANVLEPMSGPVWSYRHKARLGIRYVHKKEKVLVGFRERGSSFITETERCEILHENVGGIITDISECIGCMELMRYIPQIEVAIGDNHTVLVVRHLEPLPDCDRALLCDLAMKHSLVIYLQAGSPDELEALWPEQPEVLFYELSEHEVKIEFQPLDFTQVNPFINRKMLARVIEFLQLNKDDQVLDLFCGLGNFSLPLAKQCAHVTAVEGSLAMVKKARDNAVKNNIENIEFVYADLYSDDNVSAPWIKKKYNKILLDPPRSGASEVLKYLGKMQAEIIVYVSCHPATFARDAGALVNDLGYTITDAGIMDMFPHTAHVESMAVFCEIEIN